jgi:hypothetical protein
MKRRRMRRGIEWLVWMRDGRRARRGRRMRIMGPERRGEEGGVSGTRGGERDALLHCMMQHTHTAG